VSVSRPPVRPYTLARSLFLAAGLDSLALGCWSLIWPGDLFVLLGLTPPRDSFLWPVLGGLNLAHAGFLALAARRPSEAGFAWVAVIGRALQFGVWLFLLGTDRVRAAPLPLALLAGHEVVILAVLAAGLFAARRSAR
jgi:hypothetical protein